MFGSKGRNKRTPNLASEERSSTEPISTEEPRSDLAVPVTIAEPRRRSVRGYTLEDGPWTCRRFSTPNSDRTIQGKNFEIREESEYLSMVMTLKDVNNTDMGTKHSISVMHVSLRRGLLSLFRKVLISCSPWNML